MYWLNDSNVANNASQKPGDRPALASHRGNTHLVYFDASGKLMHGTLTPDQQGGGWKVAPINGYSGHGAIGLAVYEGKLYCTFVNGEKYVYYTTYDHDSRSWEGSKQITGITTKLGVSLAAHNGLLYMASIYESGKAVTYATYDGTVWSSTPLRMNSSVYEETSYTPLLVEYQGELHILYPYYNKDSNKGPVGNTDQIQHFRFSGKAVWNQTFIPVEPFNTNPAVPWNTAPITNIAAVEYNGLLQILVNGSDGTITSYGWDGALWYPLDVTGLPSNVSASAVIASRGVLQVVCADKSSGNLRQATGLAENNRPISATPLCRLANDAYVQTSLAPTLFAGLEPFSIEAWIKLDSVQGTHHIVSNLVSAASGDSGNMAFAVKDGMLAFFRNGYWFSAVGDESNTLERLPKMTASTWHYVAAVFDGSKLNLYRDGLLEAFSVRLTPEGFTPGTDAPMLIGAAKDAQGKPVGQIGGLIQRVAVWRGARSEAQVQQDMYARLLPQAGLVANIDFIGTAPVDTSGHGVDATLEGSVSWLAESYGLKLDGSGGLDLRGEAAEDTPLLNFAPDSPASFVGWIYPTEAPTSDAFVLWRNGQYSLGLSAAGWFGSAGGKAVIRSKAKPALNRWTHVALTYSGSNLVLYLNGARVETTSQEVPAAGQPDVTTIGCMLTSAGSAAGGFKGTISGISIWQRNLTPFDIWLLMAKNPLGMKGLAANYEFFTGALSDSTLENPIPVPTSPGVVLANLNEQITQADCAKLMDLDTSAGVAFYSLEDADEEMQALLARAARDTNMDPALVNWLIDLLLVIILGFAGILGIMPGSKVPAAVGKYLAKYFTKIVGALNKTFKAKPIYSKYGSDFITIIKKLADEFTSVAVDELVGVVVNVIFDVLVALWDCGTLKCLFEIIAENLSWSAFLSLLLSLGALFIPGANAARVANMLLALGFMAYEVIDLALSFPGRNKPLNAIPAPLTA